MKIARRLTLPTLAGLTGLCLCLMVDGAEPSVEVVGTVAGSPAGADGRVASVRLDRRPAGVDEARREAASGPWGAAVGSLFHHGFESEQRATLEAEGRGCQSLRYVSSGRLDTHVVARRGDELIAAISFADLRLDGQKDGRPARRSFAALAGELESGATLLRMRNDGTQLGFRFDPNLGPEARQWIRGVTSGLQFVVRDESVWEADERDLAGRFAVRYRWTKRPADAAAGRLVKEKLRILEIHGLDEGKAETTITGRATATLGGDLRWIAGSRTDESQEMAIPFFGTKTRAQRQLVFTLRDHGFEPVAERPSFAGDWESIDGSVEAEAIARADELARMRARLADLRIEDAALALLNAVDGGDRHAIYEARQKLLWLVRLRPADLAKLRSTILTADTRGAAALLAAIGGADTAASEAYLRGFVADTQLADGLRQASVLSLFQATRPGRETRRAVENILTEKRGHAPLRETSILLLGKFGQTSSEQTRRLLAFEENARKDGMVELWLESLGNARSEAVLPTAQRYLAHPEIGIRNSAVHSLENVRTARVTDVLVRQLARERSMVVRSSLASSLAQRSHPAAMAAIERLLRIERSEDVRKSAIHGLGLQSTARARQLLERAAAQDPVKELREMAARTLRS